MAENGIGLSFWADTSNFDEASKRYENRVKRIEEATQQAASKINSSFAKISDAAKKPANTIHETTQVTIKDLRDIRWGIITLMFYFRSATEIISKSWQLMTDVINKSAQQLTTDTLGKAFEVNAKSIASSMQQATEGALSYQQALAAVNAAMIADQGTFASEYVNLWKSAEVGAALSGAKTIDVFTELVKALEEGDAAAIDAVLPFAQAEEAMQNYALSTGRSVDQLSSLEKAQVSIQTVQKATNNALANGAQAAVDERRSFESLSAAADQLKEALFAAADVSGSISSASDTLAYSLETVTKVGVMAIASLNAMFALYDSFASRIATLPNLLELMFGGPASWGKLANNFGALAKDIAGGGLTMAMDDMMAAFKTSFEAGAEAMGLLNNELDQTPSYIDKINSNPIELDLDPLVDQLMAYEDLVSRHLEKLNEIERSYQRDLETASKKYNDTVRDIERSSQTDRDRAWRKYHNDVQDAQRDANRQLEQDAEKHRLEMLYAQLEYLNRMTQSERMYLYERSKLVAEGDVLAIEDLDARHALEQQAEQENYDLQVKRMEDMYALQRKEMEQALRDQIESLKRALQEQLAEIDAREQERKAAAKENYEQDREQAKQERAQRLAEEEADYAASLKAWAQHWADMQKQTELSSQQIANIIRDYFGDGAVADQILKDFNERAQQYLKLKMQLSTSLSGTGGGNSGTSYSDLVRGNTPSRYRTRAFGGTDIVSRPTMFMAGEAYRPEMVSVSPLQQSGGAIRLSWDGSAIPVNGTGNMSGMDLTGLGDAIAQGIVMNMGNALRR